MAAFFGSAGLVPRPAPAPAAGTDETGGTGQARDVIVTLTNNYRRAHGLAPLHPDEGLTAGAQRWSRYMADTGDFRHSNFHGYENVRWQSWAEPAAVVEGWKRSPGHNRNLLRPEVTAVGVGVARAANGNWYFTMQLE